MQFHLAPCTHCHDSALTKQYDPIGVFKRWQLVSEDQDGEIAMKLLYGLADAGLARLVEG